MAKRLYEESSVAAIAAAIRTKLGGDKTYKLSEMAAAVGKISASSSVELQEKAVEIVENGTVEILPDAGKYLSRVTATVAVESGGGNDTLAALIERSLTEIDIPSGVTVIGAHAFEAYSALTKITIPETVTKILNHAFHDCTGLTDIVIPDSVTEIGASLFHGCGNLASVRLSDGIEILQANCFYQCSKLAKVTLPATLKELKGNSLATTGKGIFDFTKCVVVPVLASGAFLTLTDAARILVPAALYDEWVTATNWAEYADYIVPSASEGLAIAYGDAWGMDAEQYTVTGRGDCTDSFVVIPEKYDDGIHGELEVKDMAYEAFINDNVLTAIYIPKTITGIGTDPISSCPNLKKIYMTGVTALASIHFNYLTALEYVKFGSGLTDIGGGVFHGCAAGAVYDFSECKSVPVFVESYYGSHLGIWEFGTEPVIKVPASLYEEWKAATNWTLYADYIVAAE